MPCDDQSPSWLRKWRSLARVCEAEKKVGLTSQSEAKIMPVRPIRLIGTTNDMHPYRQRGPQKNMNGRSSKEEENMKGARPHGDSP
jgi:hypothetical protein